MRSVTILKDFRQPFHSTGKKVLSARRENSSSTSGEKGAGGSGGREKEKKKNERVQEEKKTLAWRKGGNAFKKKGRGRLGRKVTLIL